MDFVVEMPIGAWRAKVYRPSVFFDYKISPANILLTRWSRVLAAIDVDFSSVDVAGLLGT